MPQRDRSFSVYPLKEFLETKEGEEIARNSLAGFSCAKDPDIQSFLRQKAIDMEKKKLSRTYLLGYLDADRGTIAINAYFTLAIKNIELEPGISAKVSRDFFCSGEPQSNAIAAYLIGQLGKNDAMPSGQIHLSDIIRYAESHIFNASELVGGRIMFLECKSTIKKLNDLYRGQGYRKLKERTRYSVFYKVIR